VYAEDWETANASLLAGDVIRNMMTGIISFTLLLVAGFGIYNIMNMNIMNKMKDIAILKATGFEGATLWASSCCNRLSSAFWWPAWFAAWLWLLLPAERNAVSRR
jgi:hypothetical protein